MAKLYVRAILAGTKKYSEVTTLYRPQVRQLLEAKVEAGELTQEQFEAIMDE